jgi:hypothetical protein
MLYSQPKSTTAMTLISDRIRTQIRALVGKSLMSCGLAPSSPQTHALAIEPSRLSGQAQWDRATHALATASLCAEAARLSQVSAAQQLDAANYALQQLLADLRPVMQVVRPAAALVVHRIEPPVRPTRAGEALAA